MSQDDFPTAGDSRDQIPESGPGSAPVSAAPRPPRPPGAAPGPRVTRLAVIAVVVAVLALSAFADRASKGGPTAVAVTAQPVAAPGAALSSSWFCAGPVASPAHLADGRLVIANAANRPLRGKVTLISSSGAPITQDVQVGPADRVVIAEKTAAAAPYLGAVVELDGGQAAVEQVVTGSAGTSSTACATSGSTHWYFAAGTTQESSTLSISLLNPFPDDAIVDLSFSTEQGQENPQDFQGIVIPAGTMVGFDLGTHLRRRASVATTVSLRVGRVAAFETQTVQAMSQAAAATIPAGTVPWPPGVSVARGTPSAGTSWWWPSGGASDGTTEQYVVFNPGDAEAQLSLAVDLDQGSADPFQVTVDPHAVAVVATNSESRIPKGVGHGAELRSTNGVGVVATRLVLSVAPAGQTGVAEVLGSRLQAGRWLVPGDGATDSVSPAVVVYNPGSATVTVSVSSLSGSLTPLDGQSAVVVPGHHRYVLAPTAPGAGLPAAGPLMIVAQGRGQVVVEGDSSPAKGIGMDAAIGVPLP
ncbi:MAG: hypothetical protein QOE57_313 [Acidimicrobiaceae bacterium]|nr:hypothetical protein [Acidimicrobiaceae bacterium]